MGHLQKSFADTARDGCSAVVGIDEGDVDGWGVVTWTAAMPSHLAVALDGWPTDGMLQQSQRLEFRR